MSADQQLRTASNNGEQLGVTVSSLEAQLAGFYEEQALAGGRTHGELVESVASLEAQVGALLEEKVEWESSVDSLEAQVRVLLDEKRELEEQA